MLLAGDALHSNNPIGGLGLTIGNCDAHATGNALSRVCTGQATESLVLGAANDRRKTWLNMTNKLSRLHLRRLRSEKPEDIKERELLFDRLRSDPEMPVKTRALIERIAGRSFATGASA